MILRIFNLLILCCWAALLGWLLTFGKSDLIRLIHPRLWWILGVGVVVLILFIVSLFTSSLKEVNKRFFLFELPSFLILLVPLAYITLAKDARLDSSSIQSRLSQAGDGMLQNALPSFSAPGGFNSIDMMFSKVIHQPQKYENEEVEVVCQSFTNEQLPENIAMCYRYMITCCAADALPVFLFLQYTESVDVESDRWVKVKGLVSIIKNDQVEVPAVKVDTIEYVEEPDFPWAM